ncbi:MAG: exodeoxyribonuclease VII small subunit [SAR324 cluster bacterium]|uniref:Exodeoxyribonuclease 7 small subunit n=1 Tax=SAR324 cluster bacterium TaxID=2024889 RepID=A0A2D6YM46_9DELT|nr:exodeoxyribonuclease VII small subunit [SAR324 cluster bacterium]
MGQSPSFEDSLQQLNEAVRRLESGDLALEEALQAFEEGIRHSRDCNRLLQMAEERIEMILKNEHGEYEVVPMKETE